MSNALMTKEDVAKWAQDIADSFNALPPEAKAVAAKMLDGMSERMFQGEAELEESDE